MNDRTLDVGDEDVEVFTVMVERRKQENSYSTHFVEFI
jgi:hypothetical protein